MLAAWPSLFEWVDSIRFLRIYPKGLFDDYWMPAGYPLFLKGLHLISTNVGLTVAAQHVLGVVTAILIYLTVRRLGAPQWLSLLPAALILLSGDQIYVEHIIMGETFYLFALVAALYAFVRAIMGTQSRTRLLVIAGIVVALACLSRGSALAMPVVMVAWLVIMMPGSLRSRLVRGATFGLPVAAILTGYVVVATNVGKYAGLTDMSGYDLYTRVAPFADCRRFTPPPGTAPLCETTSPSQRFGPDWYSWIATSPVNKKFPLSPATSVKVGTFARAVILHQPAEYGRAVLTDLARFVDPSIGHLRDGFGQGHFYLSFGHFDPKYEHDIAREISANYTGAHSPRTRWLAALGHGQRLLRVGRVVVLALLALVVTGAAFGRGATRRALLLVGTLTLVLYLAPVATFVYDLRYGLAPQAFLAATAALGASALFTRIVPSNREPVTS